MPIDFKHQQAFAEWYARNLDSLDQLWEPPTYDDGEVRLTVRSYAPNLVARIRRRSAVLAVEWDWEVWSTLFVAELDIGPGSRGGFVNTLADDPEEVEAIDRAQLWETFLFEPLREHVLRVVDSSACLFLCERERLRWATMSFDPHGFPQDLRYAIFGRDGAML